MAKFADGKIEAFAGPLELGASDNLEKVIIDFIAGAKHSLHIAVQELDSEAIAQAIIDAKWKGIEVMVFLEQAYLASEKIPKATPKNNETKVDAETRVQWNEYRRAKTEKTNRDIFMAMLRNAIDVKADYNPEIFHQKFIIRDYSGKSKVATSAVLTGSTNFTRTGTHKNYNHIVIFHDHRICRAYKAEFDEIKSGNFGALFLREQNIPQTYNLNGIPVRILFSPDDSPELEIIKQMLKCEKQLDFAIFTFSGSSGIDDAMMMLREARREVRGALDPGQGRQYWAATDWLHGKGIQVYFPKREPGFGKLHHKLMVIDQNIVVGGSFNYTAPANLYNDENIFVIGNPFDLTPKNGGPVDHQECGKIALFFRKVIDQIIENSELHSLA
ncbi:MAG: phospholipase [Proteobacteria bacterium]|nr:phospholipase [Pseudomonadota bacterium]